jgi:hypothetical protein
MRNKANYILVALVVFALGLIIFSFLSLSLWAKPPPDSDSLRTFIPASSVCVTVVVVSGKSESLPQAFSLSQNYPNPFNPETVIRYALPEDCQVELTIYNILGQKVKILVDEYENAGFKMVSWNGRDGKGLEVSSGVYFYVINAGRYFDVKKMVMLK